MIILYDLAFLVFALCYVPYLLFKGKGLKGALRRCGFGLRSLFVGQRSIWIHAVSVGEVRLAAPLAQRMKEKAGRPVVVSVITSTGYELACRILSGKALVVFAPLDISFIVRRFIRAFDPCLFIIVETELWPNLICALGRKGIPVVLVNGRISPASFRGYRLIRQFIFPMLNNISLFCMQSDEDRDKVTALGVAVERVIVTGNMKFDNATYHSDGGRGENNPGADFGLVADGEELWLAGSTHPGEEEIILSAYKILLSRFPRLRLLIAPRHIERVQQIEDLVVGYDFLPQRLSFLKVNSGAPPMSVFILGSIGQLNGLYAGADVVFVGGSLVKKGGQNILEPAAFSRPIIFGPHTFNFTGICRAYLSSRAAILVRSEQEMVAAVDKILSFPDEAREMGRRANGLIAKNSGATGRNIEYCLSLLPSS